MHIHSTGGIVSWTPPSLEAIEPKPSFQIAIATPADADQLGYELYRRGVIPVSQETLRATVIDELFNLYDETKADAGADLLEEVWQAEEIFQTELQLWLEQERERGRDEATGAPPREKQPMPQRNVKPRSRARSQLMLDEVHEKSDRIRELSVKMNSYPRRQEAMVLRLQLRGWSSLKVQPVFADGALTEECLDALFNEIGQEAYREIARHVSAMYDLDGEEEGNSDSLLAKELLENGSQEPSGDLVNSAGPSSNTVIQPSPSNTGQAPADGSGVTIATS